MKKNYKTLDLIAALQEMITKTKQVVVQAVGQALRALATKKSDGAATWPQENLLFLYSQPLFIGKGCFS